MHNSLRPFEFDFHSRSRCSIFCSDTVCIITVKSTYLHCMRVLFAFAYKRLSIPLSTCFVLLLYLLVFTNFSLNISLKICSYYLFHYQHYLFILYLSFLFVVSLSFCSLFFFPVNAMEQMSLRKQKLISLVELLYNNCISSYSNLLSLSFELNRRRNSHSFERPHISAEEVTKIFV